MGFSAYVYWFVGEIRTLQAKINDALSDPESFVMVFTDDREIRDRIKQDFSWKSNYGQLSFGPDMGMDDNGGTDDKQPMFSRPSSIRRALLEFLLLAHCENRTYTKGSTVMYLTEWLNQRYCCNDGTKPKEIGFYKSPNSPTMNFKTQVSQFLENIMPALKIPFKNPLPPRAMQILNMLRADQLEDLVQVMKEALQKTDNWQMPATMLSEQYILKMLPAMKANRETYNKETWGVRWLRALLTYRLKHFLDITNSHVRFGMLEDSPANTVWMQFNYDDYSAHYETPGSSSSEWPDMKRPRFL